jgi:redox-sensitive bicupin YhaK (pirin superfamily)
MWIVPEKNGLKPNYGSFVGDKEARLNQLHHIVSNFADTPSVTPVKVHQDVNMYVSEVTDANVAPEFIVKQGRMAYVLCMEGDVTLNERTSLVAHDSADVIGPGVVKYVGFSYAYTPCVRFNVCQILCNDVCDVYYI